MRQLDYSLEEARTFLAEGSPGAADIILWDLIAKNPRAPEPWGVLADLASSVGDPQTARRYSIVSRALAGDTAAAAAPAPAPVAPPGDRYLLIKAWGYGFCSDLDHTIAGLLLAEMSGRTPVIHWGRNSLFSVDTERDAFRQYFEPVSPVDLDALHSLSLQDSDVWPPKWSPHNLRDERNNKQSGPWSRLAGIQLLNRAERLIVADYHLSVVALLPWIRPSHPLAGKSVEEVLRSLMAKYLRPAAPILGEIESFAAAHFTKRPIVAVHARGSDKYKEDPQHQQKLAMYPQAIDFVSQGSLSPIFLLTDSEPLAQEYQRRYGPRIILPPAVRSQTSVGVHHSGHADRRTLGREVVRDIYLAARCDRFVGLGSSNVTATIHHLKAWPPGTTAYLSHITTHKPDPYQYLSFEQLERYFGREWSARMRQVLV